MKGCPTFASLLKKNKDVDNLSYKTVSATKANANKAWFVVDAEGQTLGRFASRVASILRGKTKTNYTPHADCGDNVIVINADKIRLTGNKLNDKEYKFYSGYPGGLRTETTKQLLTRRPIYVVEHAIKGMLPKNRLGAEMFRNLYVYQGSEHPHSAQQPKTIKF